MDSWRREMYHYAKFTDSCLNHNLDTGRNLTPWHPLSSAGQYTHIAGQ
jgi:hypothetical protein